MYIIVFILYCSPRALALFCSRKSDSSSETNIKKANIEDGRVITIQGAISGENFYKNIVPNLMAPILNTPNIIKY